LLAKSELISFFGLTEHEYRKRRKAKNVDKSNNPNLGEIITKKLKKDMGLTFIYC
jgi:hypothetical protein